MLAAKNVDPDRVVDDVERLHDAEPETRGDHCGDRHQGRGGQDPAGPAGVEARGSTGRPLRSTSRKSSWEIRKPEITKKTSTPTKPPREERNTGVARDHDQNGDRTQPLDVVPVRERRAVGGLAHGVPEVVEARVPLEADADGVEPGT